MGLPLDLDLGDMVDVVIHEGSECELRAVDLLPFVEGKLVDVGLEEKFFVLFVGVGLLGFAAEGIVVVGGWLQVLLLLKFFLLFSESL